MGLFGCVFVGGLLLLIICGVGCFVLFDFCLVFVLSYFGLAFNVFADLTYSMSLGFG